MDFFDRLDAVRIRHDVLTHPFYERWSEGLLLREELALYAGEYHHAVVALADATASAARAADPRIREELAGHAAEEAAHIALWEDFTSAVGGAVAAEPSPETADCAARWAGDPDRGLLESLVVLYAIESAQPAIAATKADGLRDFYGFAEGPATAYFTLHAELDREHAAAGRRLIAERLQGADEEVLLRAAEQALQANWRLLDGVERRLGRGEGA